MDRKHIGLKRSEYRAEGIKGEPFFAAGWPVGVAVLVMIAVGTFMHDATGPMYFFDAIGGALLGFIVQQICGEFVSDPAVESQEPPQDHR